MQSYYIHFIRHGMTVEDNKGKYIGQTDVSLSKEGIDDLIKYDRLYKYPGVGTVYTSPLLRCVQTCNILYPNVKPEVIQDFAECNFGDWEGKTAKELAGNPKFVNWLANSRDNSPENGESGADFTRRICKAFEKLAGELMSSGKTEAAVITHAGVITTLMSVYGLPQAEAYKWKMDNGFGYSVRLTPFLWMRDKVVEVYDYCPREREHEEE